MLKKLTIFIIFITLTSNALAQGCNVMHNFDLFTPEFREDIQSFGYYTDQIDRLNRDIAVTVKNDDPNTTKVAVINNSKNGIGNPKIMVRKNDGEFNAEFELLNLFFNFEASECKLLQQLRNSNQNDQGLLNKQSGSIRVVKHQGKLLVGHSSKQTKSDFQKALSAARLIMNKTNELNTALKNSNTEKGRLLENKILFITSIYSTIYSNLQ